MNKLNEAKSNLKSVLERLEKVVEKNLLEKEGTLASEVSNKMKTLQKTNSELESDLGDKDDEIKYLREENSKLQAELGEIQQQNFKLQNKNTQAVKKVDAIIGEVKTYMSNHEMF